MRKCLQDNVQWGKKAQNNAIFTATFGEEKKIRKVYLQSDSCKKKIYRTNNKYT